MAPKYESDWAISPAEAGVVEPEKRPERLGPTWVALALTVVGGMYKGVPLDGSTMAIAREDPWAMDVGVVGEVGEAAPGRRCCFAWDSFCARIEARMISESYGGRGKQGVKKKDTCQLCPGISG